MKLNYVELGIEVTRKCNQNCDGFCMRGDKQNLDINLEYIDKFLDNEFILVDSLIFSGGEPSLNDKAISYAIDKIVEENIPVLSVSLVTNGLKYSEGLVASFEKFNAYANKLILSELEKRKINDKQKKNFQNNFINKCSKIIFSNDHYHKKISDDVLQKYYDNSKNIVFSMTGDKLEKDLLKSGYSKTGRELDSIRQNIRIFGNTILDMVYLTARGNLSTFGDGSFDYIDYNSRDSSVLCTKLDEFCFRNISKSSKPSKEIKKYVKKIKK